MHEEAFAARLVSSRLQLALFSSWWMTPLQWRVWHTRTSSTWYTQGLHTSSTSRNTYIPLSCYPPNVFFLQNMPRGTPIDASNGKLPSIVRQEIFHNRCSWFVGNWKFQALMCIPPYMAGSTTASMLNHGINRSMSNNKNELWRLRKISKLNLKFRHGKRRGTTPSCLGISISPKLAKILVFSSPAATAFNLNKACFLKGGGCGRRHVRAWWKPMPFSVIEFGGMFPGVESKFWNVNTFGLSSEDNCGETVCLVRSRLLFV